ncbi:hypothetical protein LLEC1_04536 [Akanthomyces lecanii]|uniref:Uncharacterized protein n=1 Tax=Cordyceps confragosa TaxID=2714763 RepID=A0A179IUY3_CORDF|nr:hypothetical protein LLEC1_04536 [Akanthomyces lecanii]
MAPVRRYLRITKYSVLECRIYLDSPALAQSWLLHPRHQTLARVIDAIRPLVLPKLREERERERAKKKLSKKSRVKDVIVQGMHWPWAACHTCFVRRTGLRLADDFEVSMFLTETSTRHSLLFKKKHFREKGPSMMQSNANKLLGETNDQPLDVDETDFAPIRIEEESGDEGDIDLSAIPIADAQGGAKRHRDGDSIADKSGLGGNEEEAAIEWDSDGEEPPFKRRREVPVLDSDNDGEEDKKKMAMDVSYDGFAIYGRVLCLVVKRREGGTKSKSSSASGGNTATGQAKMENWITSTQMPADDA